MQFRRMHNSCDSCEREREREREKERDFYAKKCRRETLQVVDPSRQAKFDQSRNEYGLTAIPTKLGCGRL